MTYADVENSGTPPLGTMTRAGNNVGPLSHPWVYSIIAAIWDSIRLNDNLMSCLNTKGDRRAHRDGKGGRRFGCPARRPPV
jgi:hypothetical protein